MTRRNQRISPSLRTAILIAVLLLVIGLVQLWKESVSRMESAMRSAVDAAAPSEALRAQVNRSAHLAPPPSPSPSPSPQHLPSPSPIPSPSPEASLSAQIDKLEDSLSTPRRSDQLQEQISNTQAEMAQLDQEQQAAQASVVRGSIEDTRDAQESALALQDQARANEQTVQADRALVNQIDAALQNGNLGWYPDRVAALQNRRTAALAEISRLEQQSRELRVQAGMVQSESTQQQLAAERQRSQVIQQQFSSRKQDLSKHLDELQNQLTLVQQQEAAAQTQLEDLREKYRRERNAQS